ncbi:hypothetical protein [Streptococcus rupicaprae]
MMKKPIQNIYCMVLAIIVILAPLLIYITIVSFVENRQVVSIAYGICVLVWIYAGYQWLKIAKELKDTDKS